MYRIFLFVIISAAICWGNEADDPIDSNSVEAKSIKTIKFKGLKHTKEHVVYRELLNKKGESFHFSNWQKEKNKLQGLDVFAFIKLTWEIENDSLTLIYSFKELPPLIPLVGFKVTDQDGLLAGPVLAFLNLFGEDIRLEFHLRTSLPDFGETNEFLLALRSPWIFSIPLEYDFFYRKVDSYNSFLNFQEDSHQAVLNLRYDMAPTWGLLSFFDFNYLKIEKLEERLRIFESSRKSAISPKLGAGVFFDTRDNILNTKNGIYADLLWTHSGGILGGDGNSHEALIDLRNFYSVTKKHLLVGTVLTQARFGDVNNYDHFIVGGVNTLQGYDPGELIGESEALVTVEYRYDWIADKSFSLWGLHSYFGIQLLAGLDGGYVWNDNKWDKGEEGWGYYGGLHLLFPGVERVRLELGSKAARLSVGFRYSLFEKAMTKRWKTR